MQIHFLGICGTFMASLSLLAKDQGHIVTGQDTQIYPPMSTQLAKAKIRVEDGYAVTEAIKTADIVVVGNVMCRGMPVIEYLLENKQPLISGPEFLAKYILQDQHVLVVAGTHGKTTTTSMLAWILTKANLKPGYLIGGVPINFPLSASLGAGKYFVVEGDEYDSAFFDKRSKFIHYRPNTLIINNLEYDHADIFPDLQAIQTQFHHMIRAMPASGCIITPEEDPHVAQVLAKGCWSKVEHFGLTSGEWQLMAIAGLINSQSFKEKYALNQSQDQQFNKRKKQSPAKINMDSWPFFGEFNYLNALAAIAAAQNVGVKVEDAVVALCSFAGIKRRLELIGKVNNIAIYDDFAHHPTAIKVTLNSLIDNVAENERVIAIVDVCSNTMRAGTHQDTLGAAVARADKVYFYHDKKIDWDINKLAVKLMNNGGVYQHADELIAHCVQNSKPGDHLLLMSNGAFAGIHHKLLAAMQART